MNRIQQGDIVEIISGEERGSRGEVQYVMPKDNRVVVHGVNLVKKHQRRTGNVRTQTGIIEFEAPIAASKVMPVCPTCDRPVRVGFERLGDGRKVRVCKGCGEHSLD